MTASLRKLKQTDKQRRARKKALAIKPGSSESFVDTLTGEVVLGYEIVPDARLVSIISDAAIVIKTEGRYKHRDYVESRERLIFGQAVRIWLDGNHAYRNLEDLESVK